jgi:tungstate transport system ATP-binding protein
MNDLLELRKVRACGGGRVLLDIEQLAVQQGERLVLLGPTGAGKSTLLRVMNALIVPDRGTLLWKGAVVQMPAPIELRRCMTMVMQEPLLFRGSVFDNVAWALRIRGMRGGELRSRVQQALELFGIQALGDRVSSRLSGGEAHRVALARAIALRPELLLLDEPLSSVDEVLRDRLRDELSRIITRFGLTCVYVTHDQLEAQKMADRVVVLQGGKVAQCAAPELVFHRPANVQVARFVRTRNLMHGRIACASDGCVQVQVGEQRIEAVSDLPVGDPVVCCLRPEEVVLSIRTRASGDAEQRSTVGEPVTGVSDAAAQRSVALVRQHSARNRWVGRIEAIERRGAVDEVTVQCGPTLVAVITHRSTLDMGLGVGDVVEATFKATAVHVLQAAEVPCDAIPC